MQSANSIHHRRSLLERLYIKDVLEEQGENLRKDHIKRIKNSTNTHTGKLSSGPTFTVRNSGAKGGELEMIHLKRQRFLDMKRFQSRKRRFPIHNKVIFAHTSDLIRQLMYGYTEEIKIQLQQKYRTIEL